MHHKIVEKISFDVIILNIWKHIFKNIFFENVLYAKDTSSLKNFIVLFNGKNSAIKIN